MTTHAAFRLRALADWHEQAGTCLPPHEMRALASSLDALPDTEVTLTRLRNRARWKSEAGNRLWAYSGYGKNNRRLGDQALGMCGEAGAMERAADFIETGVTTRVRRQYRSYDIISVG